MTDIDDFCFTCNKRFNSDFDIEHTEHRTLGNFLVESNRRMKQWDKAFTILMWVIFISVFVQIVLLILKIVLVLNGG
jgi:hypothetical protein